MIEVYMCRKMRTIFNHDNTKFFKGSLNALCQERLGEDFTNYEDAYKFTTSTNTTHSKNPYMFNKLPGTWKIFKVHVKKENISIIDQKDNSVKIKGQISVNNVEGCYITLEKNQSSNKFYRNEDFLSSTVQFNTSNNNNEIDKKLNSESKSDISSISIWKENKQKERKQENLETSNIKFSNLEEFSQFAEKNTEFLASWITEKHPKLATEINALLSLNTNRVSI